jgi:Protein of unknown function (DUF3489)
MTTNEATTAPVAEQGAQIAPDKAPSKTGASKKTGAPKRQKRVKAAKPALKPKAQRNSQSKAGNEKPVAREGTAKAKVIALIQRNDGATLDEIMKTTKWKPHTVRGLISVLGNKHGMKIESRRREDGARVYEAAK